ncbi:MAG: hypothetical protein KIT14_12555 [bacterium]|nr:hypothetical protein [bacterium]
MEAILDDLLAFTRHFDLTLYDWQADAFGQACARVDQRFKYRLAGISVPRGNGKSYGGALVGLWRLLCGPPPQDIISAALDYDGAKVVLEHARQIVRAVPALADVIEVGATGLSVPATGSRWTVTTREHTASRGRHPTLVVYDEIGWAKDTELFSSLLAGQASVDDPLMIVISTVGRRQAGPLWTVKVLADGGDDGVFWWWSGQNLSPKVTPTFLERQRRILVAAQFAREHGNQWVDAADSFVSAEDVDRAQQQGWREQTEGDPDRTYRAYVDVGIVHDPSVIAIGHQEGMVVFVDRLLTFQGSKREPVQIEALEHALVDLSRKFNLTQIRIESWQGIAVVQRLAATGLPVELFTPTPKSNAEEWPQLAQRIGNGSLVLFPHARLREELLNLTVEVGPSGAKVVDKGKVHQDHAVAVRGVCASFPLVEEGPLPDLLHVYGPSDSVAHIREEGAGLPVWMNIDDIP